MRAHVGEGAIGARLGLVDDRRERADQLPEALLDRGQGLLGLESLRGLAGDRDDLELAAPRVADAPGEDVDRVGGPSGTSMVSVIRVSAPTLAVSRSIRRSDSSRSSGSVSRSKALVPTSSSGVRP